MTTFLKPNMLGSPAIGAHNICRVQPSRNARGDHVSGSTTHADFTDVRTGTRAQQTQLHLSQSKSDVSDFDRFRSQTRVNPSLGGERERAIVAVALRSNAKASHTRSAAFSC